MAKAQDISEVCIHVITDGRDTKPTAGKHAIKKIQDFIQQAGLGRMVTLSGRYYAMDRDHRSGPGREKLIELSPKTAKAQARRPLKLCWLPTTRM